MKLNRNQITQFKSIIDLCNIVKFESFIIENGKLRGINANKTCVIITDNNIPNLSHSITISRVQALKQRLGLFNLDNTEINCRESNDQISVLEITNGKNNAQFRCASSSQIKAPKEIVDQKLLDIIISDLEVKEIMSANSVMKADVATILITKKHEVYFIFMDANRDKFEIKLDNEALISDLDNFEDSVSFNFTSDLLNNILRNAISSSIFSMELGLAGTLKIKVNEYPVILIPQVSDNDD